jgi:gas vesicle protein
MDNSHHTLKVIGALAIGTLTGILFGVLFAPDLGCKTRAKLLGKQKREDVEVNKRMKEDIIAFRLRANQLEKLLVTNLQKTKK